MSDDERIGLGFAELDRVAYDYGAGDVDLERAMLAVTKAVDGLRLRGVHPVAAEYALGGHVAFLLACSPAPHRRVYAERFLAALRKEVDAQCSVVDAFTAADGTQPPSGLRGDPGVPRTVTAPARGSSSSSED